MRGVTVRHTITATAPIRICDLGGWTDTWAARRGSVLNIAVEPLVEVRLEVWPRGTSNAPVTIAAADYGMRYAPDLDAAEWGPHPLLEGALRTIRPPDDIELVATVHSTAPPGASTGTSAAVLVALLGALDRLVGGSRTAAQLATDAHHIETQLLGQESGVQDQLCAAHGGINFIEISDYPRAVVQPLTLAPDLLDALADRLLLVYLGRPHHSSAVHERVLIDLARQGPDTPALGDLRAAATKGRDALVAGDLPRFGEAMRENTAAQAALHASLVSDEMWGLIAVARTHGALGWKVNGAGGDGGSLTFLMPDARGLEAVLQSIARRCPQASSIPIALASAGLRVVGPALG
jgi:D-glycero-alpha-D-manno-heptose-7-phosphate kinase